MSETTSSKLEDGTEITIQGAHSPTAYRREWRYAARTVSGQGTACIDLTIERTDNLAGYYVRFNRNRGRGWMTARRSKEVFATEAAARAFADKRWAYLLTWISNVVPQPSNWQPDFTCH